MAISPDIEDGSLHRPHIRDDGLRRQGLKQRILRLQQGLERQRQHDKITALEAGRVATDSINKPALKGTLRCAVAMHEALNADPKSTQIQPDRATDQAKTHNTDPADTSEFCDPLLIHHCCPHPAHVARLVQGSEQLSLNR